MVNFNCNFRAGLDVTLEMVKHVPQYNQSTFKTDLTHPVDVVGPLK